MTLRHFRPDVGDDLGPSNRTLAILLISALGLFLEMLLIRLIGTEVRIFAYLQNAILVVCFLGLGLGCLTSRQPIRLRQALIPLGFLILLLAVPATRTGLARTSVLLSVLEDFTIWGEAIVTDPWLAVLFLVLGLAAAYLLLVLVLDAFVPIGRILGRLMDEHPRTIWAYSVNIAGSLLGTWLFVLVSYLYQPPATWFAILAALFAILVIRSANDRRVNIALLLGIVALSWFASRVPDAVRVVWSPYQKLVVRAPDHDIGEIGDYIVTVNNTGYQMMADLSASHVAADPARYAPEMNGLSQYDIPLLLHPNPRSYLVVGAGAGNDAAGGVRHGVARITAVEIDPAIIALGRSYHPEQPYVSSSVEVVNDDARSFFATSGETFDVIAFGLLDSHTTTAMTNARLDHYVYTEESLARAKSLLAPGGVMVLSFEAQKPYIADRMARALRDLFGEEPIVFRIPSSSYGWGGVMFVAGDLAVAREQIAGNPRLASFIEASQRAFPVPLEYGARTTTDDWPYLYLESRRIPSLYFLLAGLMVLIVYRSCRRWRASGLAARWSRSHWHFAFLGAAFLLLEVQNISKASVVLGSTWQVNAVIVSGVLAMALLANLIAHRFPALPMGLAYGALLAICLALYMVDLAQFAFLPYATKVLAVGGLTGLPMLSSGVIFTRSLADVVGKDQALGANMIGSLAGALLQSVTFVLGIKALLLLVAGLYCLSWLTKAGLARQRSGNLQSVEA